MKKKRRFTVDDAYAISTPADSVRLYDDWAETYDREFVEDVGYIAHRRVAESLLQHQSLVSGVVLDVGCGTGIVGTCLREGGIEVVDGIDISPQMLTVAGRKRTNDNKPVYRRLVEADLTRTLDIPNDQYGGLVSAGTFTHGHLGTEPLEELWRIAAPGAICAIGVRSTHYESMGFEERLSRDVGNATITQPEIVVINLYLEDTSNTEHAEDKAVIVVCRVI